MQTYLIAKIDWKARIPEGYSADVDMPTIFFVRPVMCRYKSFSAANCFNSSYRNARLGTTPVFAEPTSSKSTRVAFVDRTKEHRIEVA